MLCCLMQNFLNLQPSNFDDSAVARLGMGSGVVPIAYDRDGDLCLLLGRERYLPNWKGSCRWSGFEGSRKESESLDDTACREFEEESMRVLASTDSIVRMVRDDTAWKKIVLRIQNDRFPERYHCTHVVHVDYEEGAPETFHSERLRVEAIDRTAQEMRITKPEGLGEYVLDVLEGDGGNCEVRTVRDDVIRAQVFGGDAGKDVLKWARVRDRVKALTDEHPIPPSVVVQKRYGFLHDVVVEKDFLEKDQLRWWKTKHLLEVLRNKGQLENDRFRPYFLPVLQVILEEAHKDPPPLPDHMRPQECATLPPSAWKEPPGSGRSLREVLVARLLPTERTPPRNRPTGGGE